MSKAAEKPMFQKYRLEMRFEHWLVGGTPLREDLVRGWLEARKPDKKPTPHVLSGNGEVREIAEMEASVATMLPPEEDVQERTKGFLRNEDGELVVPGFHVRSHAKDCASKAKEVLGIKALKSKVDRAVYVTPQFMRILKGKDRKPILAPDGVYEHPCHAFTPMGPRTSLTRAEYVEQPILVCELNVLNDGVITEEILHRLFEYGQIHGFGAERNLQQGMYKYELTPV